MSDGWTRAARRSVDREVVKIVGTAALACGALGALIGLAVDVLIRRHARR